MTSPIPSVSRDVELSSGPCKPRQVDFGLVIGVDHYPRFRSLQGAIADAHRLHEWLCDPDGGSVAPEYARLIVSRPNPAAPLQDEVDEQLLDLVTAADAVGGGRRLYFHFSGHGAGSPDDSRDDVALLLAKWSRKLARLALSTDEYRGVLGGMGLFREIVVTLDCCRTTAERVVGLPPTITHRPRSQRCATRMFVAYATEAGGSAFEMPDCGDWQGVFTHSLLAILRHAPHGITAAELKRALEYELALTGQRAHVVNGLHETSVFGRRGVLPKVVIAFDRAAGRVRLRDGTRTVIAEREADAKPWVLSLQVGFYKLEDDAHSVSFDHGRSEVTHVRF